MDKTLVSVSTSFSALTTAAFGILLIFPSVFCSRGLQSAPWKRWRAPLSTRPAISRLTADSTPIPKAPPCPRSTGAPTPAPSLKQRSLPTGRSCAWRPARGLEGFKNLAKARETGHKGWDGTLQRLTTSSLFHNSDHPHHPLELWLRNCHTAAMIVCAYRKSAGWKTLLQSTERASDYIPCDPPLFLFSLVLHLQPPPSSNIDNSKPQTRQLGHLRTLCFVVLSVKPLPLPQVFLFVFCLGEEVEHVRCTPPSTAIYIYIFVSFVILDTNPCRHTHLDKLSRGLPF